jgi:hypothetical protein
MIRPLRAPPWTIWSYHAASGGLHWGCSYWTINYHYINA